MDTLDDDVRNGRSGGSGSASEDLVVVGSSGAELEGLEGLLGGLEPGFPPAIVVTHPVASGHDDSLVKGLESVSRLPVVIASEGVALTPGTVYVVPSNRLGVVREGRLELEEQGPDRQRAPLDHLLASAAESYGERLVAVILMGSGS